MLPSLGDNPHAKKQRYQLVLFFDIVDQRILQSDWTRNSTGYKQPKVIVPGAIIPWWLTPWKIPSIDYFQRNWWSKNLAIWLDRSLTGHNQPKVIVLDATFPWWLSPCKKSKITFDSIQKYWWLKNPAIWLNQRRNWPHPIKSSILRCYLHLMIKAMQKT